MGMCADFAIHNTDGHNPHAHILLTVRPLNENGTWQYKTEKEYLCIKMGKKEDLLLLNFKTAQKQGWKKQYRYKVWEKERISDFLCCTGKKDMNELINTPRAADMADRILFPNNGTVMNNFVSGGQTGQMP